MGQIEMPSGRVDISIDVLFAAKACCLYLGLAHLVPFVAGMAIALVGQAVVPTFVDASLGLASVTFLVLIRRILRSRGADDEQLWGRIKVKDAAVGVGLGLVTVAIVHIAVHEIRMVPGQHSLVSMIAGLTSTGIATPLAEEVAYRALLYRALRSHLSASLAIPISAALFVLGHPFDLFNVSIVLPVAIVGALCAAVLERTGSLTAPVLLHATYNSTIQLMRHITL